MTYSHSVFSAPQWVPVTVEVIGGTTEPSTFDEPVYTVDVDPGLQFNTPIATITANVPEIGM